MEPIKTIDAAKKYVEASFTRKEETLILSDTLIDLTGLNMALILDAILGKGYMPDGFEQKEGFRIYKYIKD